MSNPFVARTVRRPRGSLVTLVYNPIMPTTLRHALSTLACLTLAASASDGLQSALSGPYKAGARNWTLDGHPVICDTAGPVSRSVRRCC